MNNNISQTSGVSRRKFMLSMAMFSILAALSSITGLRFFNSRNALTTGNKNKTTVKMLTQDGKLVEVDQRLIASANRKITNKELQNWIKK